MAINKVVYGQDTLIDLTADTVTADALLAGTTAHKADGTTVTGTLFDGFPAEQPLYDTLCDSDGNSIKDSTENAIQGKIVYRRT